MNNCLETTKTIDRTASNGDFNIRRMVVAVDLSPRSEQVVASAAELAKKFGACVTLLYVFPTETLGESTNQQPPGSCEQEHRLKALKLIELMGVVRQTGVECDYDFLTGDAAEQVTLAAKVLKTDLIITTIHQPNSLVRLFGLDQAPRILDRANCPVLVFQQ